MNRLCKELQVTGTYLSFSRCQHIIKINNHVYPALLFYGKNALLNDCGACLRQSCGSMSICDFKPPVSQLLLLGKNENHPKT